MSENDVGRAEGFCRQFVLGELAVSRRDRRYEDLVSAGLEGWNRCRASAGDGVRELRVAYLESAARRSMVRAFNKSLRAGREVTFTDARLEPSQMASGAVDPAVEAEETECRERLLAALELLADESAAEATAVHLRDYEGRTWAEVGEALGVGASGARAAYGRAIVRLRRLMRVEDEL